MVILMSTLGALCISLPIIVFLLGLLFKNYSIKKKENNDVEMDNE